MKHYILTYTKTKFEPLNPVIEDIHIEDIAHALSMLARANGHFPQFYSVGQHSLNCCKEARVRGYSSRVQLGCLLHDASECYISDLTRPVKIQLPEYSVIEEKLQSMIYQRFGLSDLTEEEMGYIKDVDDTLLYHEFVESMGEPPVVTDPPHVMLKHDFSQREIASVEKEFLYTFRSLTKDKKGYSYVGIDGCKNGWVAVEISDTGFDVDVYHSIEEICSKFQDAGFMLVDMPIGLPESIDDIRPDSDVRKLLSGRSSCIFNTPCRQAVYLDDYREASMVNQSIMGKGLSKQSFAISPQIREIDELLQRRPDLKDKLKESHPELCFAVLASSDSFILPLYNSKHTPEGHEDRVDTLQEYYDRTYDVIDFIIDNPNLCKLMEDCVDALCLAITAWLGSKHGYRTVPTKPKKDNRGIPMQMVYAGVREGNIY